MFNGAGFLSGLSVRVLTAAAAAAVSGHVAAEIQCILANARIWTQCSSGVQPSIWTTLIYNRRACVRSSNVSIIFTLIIIIIIRPEWTTCFVFVLCFPIILQLTNPSDMSTVFRSKQNITPNMVTFLCKCWLYIKSSFPPKITDYKHTKLPLRNSYLCSYYRISYSELSASVMLRNVNKCSEQMFKTSTRTCLLTSFHPRSTLNDI